MLKGSNAPAHTISPLLSTAKHVNWTGVGVVNVRKFRYLFVHLSTSRSDSDYVSMCMSTSSSPTLCSTYHPHLHLSSSLIVTVLHSVLLKLTSPDLASAPHLIALLCTSPSLLCCPLLLISYRDTAVTHPNLLTYTYIHTHTHEAIPEEIVGSDRAI